MRVEKDGQGTTGLAYYNFFAAIMVCYDVNNPLVYSCVELSADLFEDLKYGSMYPFTFEGA